MRWIILGSVLNGCTVTVEVAPSDPALPGSGASPVPTGATSTPSSPGGGGATTPTAPLPSGGPCGGECTWRIETVDHAGGIRATFAADVGPDGRLHVLLFDDQGDEYRYLVSGGWTSEVVDHGPLLPTIYTAVAIAVDSDDLSHLVIGDNSYRYHRATPSGGWVSEDLGSTGLSAIGPSVHVGLDGPSPVLFLNKETAWWDVDHFAEGPRLQGSPRDVRVDASGIHGLWEAAGELYRGSMVGASWSSELVPGGETYDASLAADSAGQWHVGASGSAAVYAWSAPAGWDHLVLSDGWNEDARGASLTVDADDRVLASYGSTSAAGEQALAFAWLDAAGWHRQELDSVWVWDTVVRVDPVTGYPIVVYLDFDNDEVRVAWGEPA